MTQTHDTTDVAPRATSRRWLRFVWLALLVAVVIGVGLWLTRRVRSVEVVSPGALIVQMDGSEFANAYSALVNQKEWQIVRESGRGAPGGTSKTRVGRAERVFRMADGMEVTVDATFEGDRHIVFLSFRPTGEPPSNEEMRRRSEEITNLLANAWRAEANRSRWDRVRKMFP